MKEETPRLDYVLEKACEFLLSSSFDSLPINPFTIIKNNGWGLTTYRKLASELSTKDKIYTLTDIVKASQSKDGFTVFKNGSYCIAYNDAIETKNRINFTLCHEIGHIVLLHFENESGNNEFTKSHYLALEAEANYFASNLLAPKTIIELCKIKTPKLLSAATGLSLEAATKRLDSIKSETINNDKNYSELIKDKFKTYIEITKRRNKTLITL